MLVTTPELEIQDYQRPKNSKPLTKPEREALLRDYFVHYRRIAEARPELLNQKLPREVLKSLLVGIGKILIDQSKELAEKSGPVKDFLDLNDLPPSIRPLLPPDFRAFCLALNALKQWVSAEQQATDRYLLGGNARAELRRIAATCIATGAKLDNDCELHHPVRDGRPPIPLCREAHEKIEQQGSKNDANSNPAFAVISEIRRQNNNSWKNLRRGCLELLGSQVKHSTPAVRAGSKAFARKAAAASGLSFQQIIDLLDEYELGAEIAE